jgi:adenylate kinase family enzyme
MRVAILGNSGSGKSTLAAALAAAGGTPCLDLDTVAWEPGQSVVPRNDEFACADVRDFCRRGPHWVVEGCYATLIEAALEFTPTLLFLNPGLEACLANCRSRPWEPHKYASQQEQDANLQFLLSWVADYYTRTGPLSLAAHASCFQSYAGPKRELRSLPDLRSLDPKLLAWVRSGPASRSG